MSILVKAGTGLAAGVVAGALGLAFLPRVEPTGLQPRMAVEKPQFVAAPASTPESVASTRAAPALAVASEAPAAKPKPTPEAKIETKPAAAPPKPVEAAEVKPAPTPSALAAIAMASVDLPKGPPKPSLGETRSVAFAPAVPAPAAAPAQPAPPAPSLKPASDEAARWSVRGLVALAKGDISSARLYLARAADAGDPRALVALADTYDPAMLAKLGVVMTPGDATRAREYLVKAAAAGVVVSKDRMAALDSDQRGN